MFEKVDRTKWTNEVSELYGFSVDVAEELYDGIKLPRRATKLSAGYDFLAPYPIELKPGESEIIHTGIAWRNMKTPFMHSVSALKIYPKSGLGFKYQLGVKNTVGIIDGDFYPNEILIALVNNGDKTVCINTGQGFVQGLVELCFCDINYDLLFDTEVREGGFGSTKNSKGEL